MSAFSGGSAFFSNTPEKANKWFLILKPFLTTEEMKPLETKTRKYGRKKTPTGLVWNQRNGSYVSNAQAATVDLRASVENEKLTSKSL